VAQHGQCLGTRTGNSYPMPVPLEIGLVELGHGGFVFNDQHLGQGRRSRNGHTRLISDANSWRAAARLSQSYRERSDNIFGFVSL
jgi:hypothetical protein